MGFSINFKGYLFHFKDILILMKVVCYSEVVVGVKFRRKYYAIETKGKF